MTSLELHAYCAAIGFIGVMAMAFGVMIWCFVQELKNK